MGLHDSGTCSLPYRALLFPDTSDSVQAAVGYVLTYMRKYSGFFLLAVFFLSGEAICDLMQPTIMSKVVDVGVANRDLHYVLARSALMLLIAGLGAISATGRNIVASTISQAFGADLRGGLYRRVMTLSFGALDRFGTATLVNRLTNDVNQVQTFVNGMMRIFVKAPLVCIGGIIMAILLDPHLARVLEIALPIVALLVYLSLRMGFPRYRSMQTALDGVNGVFREYLAGARVVKAFNRFSYEADRFSSSNNVMASVSARAMRIMAIFSPGLTLTVNLGIVAVLWIGGLQVDGGQVGPGHVIAFVNYMTQILGALMMVAMIFSTFVRARASAERIKEVMIAEDRIGQSPAVAADGVSTRHSGTVASAVQAASGGPVVSGDDTESVRFDRVTFSYAGPDGLPALRDVSFSCAPGETIGIIGATGSGKTSLVDLIPRFRDVTAGVVSVRGTDVRFQEKGSLRSRISIVPQRTLLFTGTIRENILWGDENAGPDEVEAAARIAQASEFIDAIDEGMEAPLGRGGVNLSGGQKQRVAIARAIIRKPEILILDDCSSALDSITEAKLQDALRRELSGTTLLIVAQRITSVMTADRIIVLDDGNLAGVGSHAELLSSCEVYRDIYRSQIGRVEDSGG